MYWLVSVFAVHFSVCLFTDLFIYLSCLLTSVSRFLSFSNFGFPCLSFTLYSFFYISLSSLILHMSAFTSIMFPSIYLLITGFHLNPFLTPFSFSYSFPSPTLSLLHESYTHLQLFPSCFLPSLFFIKTFHRDPFNAAHIGNELCIRQWPPLEKTSRREF